MQGYTDASFASNPDSRKSTTGLIFLSGGPVSVGAKTQSLTAQSIVEAEIMAISYTTKEAVSTFASKLHFFGNFSNVPISSDSTGALTIAANFDILI